MQLNFFKKNIYVPYAKIENKVIADKKINNKNVTISSFENVEFNSVTIKKSRFTFSRFENITFTKTTITKSNLSCTKIMCAKFYDCSIIDIDFSYSVLKKIEFKDCHIKNVKFANAKFESIDIINSNIVDSNFDLSAINKTNILLSKVVTCIFDFVDTCDFIVKNSFLQDSTFNNSSMMKTIFEKVFVSNCKFDKIIFTYSLFYGFVAIDTYITDSNLSASTISFSHFSRFSLFCSNLNNAKINNTMFNCCDLKRTKLEDMASRETVFIDTDFCCSDIGKCCTDNATFVNCIISSTTFENGYDIEECNEQCSICLETNVDTYTNCDHNNNDIKHYFHSNCLEKWLNSTLKSDCPICRRKIIMYGSSKRFDKFQIYD